MNTSLTFRRLFAAAAIGAFATSFTVAAHAAQSTDAPQVIVKYADLAVSTPQGAAALYQRIFAAALTVCRPLDDSSLSGKQWKDACIHKAVADAVARVDQPALSAVYRAKNPEAAFPVLTAGNR
jgi:UrcA family protein